MPNVALTTRCNQKCEYCFAAEYTHSKPLDISTRTFNKVLRLLKCNELKTLRLIGGEPTLHPRFCPLIRKALRDGFGIILLSNGLWPREIRRFLEKVPHDRIMYAINVNHPDRYKKNAWREVERTLDFLKTHTKTALSINLDPINSDYGYIFYLANRYEIRRVRYAVTRPSLDHPLPPLPPKKLVKLVTSFLRDAGKNGVLPISDCSFLTPCIIKESGADAASLQYLELDGRSRKLGKCIPVIDILPDFTAIYCFGIGSKLSLDLKKHDSIDEIVAIYEYVRKKTLEVSSKCSKCLFYSSNRCLGGCWSERIIANNISWVYDLFQRLAEKDNLYKYPLRLTGNTKIKKVGKDSFVISNTKPPSHNYYSSDEVALMKHLLNEHSPQKRIEHFCNDQSVSKQRAKKDLNSFICTMISDGIIDFAD